VNSFNALDRQLSEFLDALEGLRHQLYPEEGAVVSTSAVSTLSQQQTCQRLFQEIVTHLADADLTPTADACIRPAQTEAHRLLRLMGVDVMRLKAAKRPEVAKKLRSQLLNQTERLQGFGQAMLEALRAENAL